MMRVGTLVKPRRNRGIALSLISPDIRRYVVFNRDQVGIVIPFSSAEGLSPTWVRVLVGDQVGDGYEDELEVLCEPC
jgi:hypothetical protein